MIFERRVYKLLPGEAEAFWDLQRLWNTPRDYASVLERNIGYFQSDVADGVNITHLYRYDSLDDWDRRLRLSYSPERAGYLAAARKLVLEQESGFYDPSPLDALNPLWSQGRDWLPGLPAFEGVTRAQAGRVVEELLDFRPGGVAAYWAACEEDPTTRDLAVGQTLVGAFASRVGVLHRVARYRWFEDAAAAAHAAAAFPRPGPPTDWQALLRRRQVNLLAPSPVAWMRPLFEPVDWALGGDQRALKGAADG